jgi:TfoX/Sxy family transcriptional regulator of competence genes
MKMPRPDSGDRAFFHSVLPKDPRINLRAMFGNDAAFVNGNMFAGLFGRDLFVRLPEQDQKVLLKEKGAARFTPIEGRPMGGYIVIPSAWRAHPERASEWVAKSAAWASGLPAKTPKKSKS